jgi:hypothetical protein
MKLNKTDPKFKKIGSVVKRKATLQQSPEAEITNGKRFPNMIRQVATEQTWFPNLLYFHFI